MKLQKVTEFWLSWKVKRTAFFILILNLFMKHYKRTIVSILVYLEEYKWLVFITPDIEPFNETLKTEYLFVQNNLK